MAAKTLITTHLTRSDTSVVDRGLKTFFSVCGRLDRRLVHGRNSDSESILRRSTSPGITHSENRSDIISAHSAVKHGQEISNIH